jgi:16S rRNA (cytosine1402-N4)-methyltransferase
MEKHTTVLLTEAIDSLAITEDSIVVDATLGSGGHAQAILERLGKKGTYIGIDADPLAVENARARLHGDALTTLVVGNFRDLNSLLDAHHIQNADAILADLGWRMEQFSGNGKGFSFQVDEPLIMTFGEPSQYPFTAHDIVNEWEEEHLIDILEGYGEEKFARRIARGIVTARSAEPIKTTFELVQVIRDAVPGHYRNGKINPATRTFQALRITVNDELGALTTFLEQAVSRLSPNGRLAVITFHSLEDRVVKHTMRSFAHDHRGSVITKKPILPTRDEIQENRRARSAKLRVFQKNEQNTSQDSTL